MRDPAFMKWSILLLACWLSCKAAVAQPCTGTIANFPYFEGFETGTGNWTTGGISSDWTWGTPAKSLITGAGEGQKCWITGGLNKTIYNAIQRSWLLSPCFNFSTLNDPEISFKIFWDTEREFDGATLQYSLDNGSTWLFIGNYSPTAITCESENWYNAPGIFYVTGSRGWAGNNHIYDPAEACVGGGGSFNWLDAKHVIHELGGQSSVRFRFTFGSGPACNEFNGFAVDAIQIRESPANSLSFTKKCNAADSRKVDFSFDGNCVTDYSWDFGDPASGTANTTSVIQNPSHVFSGPGTYKITLKATFLYGPPGTSSSDVNIIDANPVIVWPGKCTNVSDATLSVSVVGPALPFTYNWNTVPAQSGPSVSNVGSGNYAVTVTAPDACAASADFMLKASPFITVKTDIKDAVCEGANGSITAAATGGIAPLQYEWSNGRSGPMIDQVTTGKYSVIVRDDNGCEQTVQGITVTNSNHFVPVDLGPDVQVCPGQTVYLKPGAFNSYTWQNGSHAPVFKANLPGKYFVTVTDNEGCSGSDTLRITGECNNVFFPSAMSPDGNGVNDGFGPIGDLPAVKEYRLSIYDRFGNRVFYSTDPFQQWNGQSKKDLYGTNAFAWMSDFMYKGERRRLKGTFLLIR